MRLMIATILSFCLMSCQNADISEHNNPDERQLNKKDSITPAGYWQIPMGSRSIRIKDEVLSPGNYLFYYDNNNISMYLFTEKAWMWRSKDDYYKLKAKWGHDTLYYLPPFGLWTYLATYNGKNFIATVQNKNFKYDKINKNEISKNDSAILKERNLHNYIIKPMDKCN